MWSGDFASRNQQVIQNFCHNLLSGQVAQAGGRLQDHPMSQNHWGEVFDIVRENVISAKDRSTGLSGSI